MPYWYPDAFLIPYQYPFDTILISFWYCTDAYWYPLDTSLFSFLYPTDKLQISTDTPLISLWNIFNTLVIPSLYHPDSFLIPYLYPTFLIPSWYPFDMLIPIWYIFNTLVILYWYPTNTLLHTLWISFWYPADVLLLPDSYRTELHI